MEEPYKVAFDVGTQPTQDSWTSLIWSLLIVSVVFQGMRRPMADRLAMLGLDVGVARSAVLGSLS